MILGERIKKLRRSLDLTQQEFADKIGSKRNTVATYEMGRTDPSAAVVSLICREFNVSETWLRTGEGEMFVQRTRTDELSLFVDQLLQSEPDDIRRRFVTAISRLSTKQLEVLEGAALRLADELNAAADQGEAIPYRRPATEEEKAWARAEAEAYYRELLLEKKAPGGSSASGGQSAEGTKGA